MADHLHQQQQQQQLELPPGFRYHPTDEEIINSYLTPKVLHRTFVAKAIGEVDLNKNEPWELPGKAKMGEKEWYFYCQKDRKYPTGIRTNRATEAGYWKATGKDKEIAGPESPVLVGMKKTLVFYKGRAPRGEKTNWVMHEYRLEIRKAQVPYAATSSAAAALISAASKDEWVVCRIFHKTSGIKKVVMPSPSYAMGVMPMSMGDQQQQQQSFVVDSGTACTLPPLMDYATSSSSLAPPPPQLYAPSSYQLHAAGAVPSMMNGHYFGNHHHQMLMAAAPPPMSFYHQQQQTQMQMMDQGCMAGAEPASGQSLIISQEGTGTGLCNNDQGNAAAEISSMDMGMDAMWKY